MNKSFKAQIKKEGQIFFVDVNFTESYELSEAKDYAEDLMKKWIEAYPELKDDGEFRMRIDNNEVVLKIQ
ncbi:hypothetical protein M899_0602 [Bacteriovorax sp. BSW11_IV]|uniref:hypothetical protein n=1 Tax=Bacteriovorax sp. BSW11_IV TaxID=1353529 RepID=UPI00038A2761|nr:hypothetical protein [Bacteriovorax sp. BSW11_IV]EQC48881.1 hypothetical protein M899_0602 [Bacteriovorax sp. BSW11_IV]